MACLNTHDYMQIRMYVIKQTATETNACFYTFQTAPELILHYLDAAVPEHTIRSLLTFWTYESGVGSLINYSES